MLLSVFISGKIEEGYKHWNERADLLAKHFETQEYG